MDNDTQDAFSVFCGGTLWNTTLTWETTPPALPPCFQRSVLAWVGAAWAWGTLPVYGVYLRGCTGHAIPTSRLHVAKLVVCLLMVALTLGQLIDSIIAHSNHPSERPLVLIVSPAINTCTLLLVTVLIHAERKSGLVTSGVLFIYWLLSLLAGAGIVYSLVMPAVMDNTIEDVPGFAIFFTLYGASMIEFVFFCFAEKARVHEMVCPEVTSSFLSRITYSWLDGLVVGGYKRTLRENDMWPLKPGDRSASTGPALETVWRAELARCRWRRSPSEQDTKQPKHNWDDYDERSSLLPSGTTSETHSRALLDDVKIQDGGRQRVTPSLFRTLLYVFGPMLLVSHLCKLVCDVLTFLGPILQRLLIGYTEDSTQPVWRGYVFAVASFLLPVVESFFFQMLCHIGFSVGMRVKSAIIYLIYKKALVLSNEARKQTTVGEIVNLMSVDAQRLQDVAGWMWMVWSSPLQVAVAVWLLWDLLGPAVLGGLAVIITLIPINVLLAARQQKLQVKQMDCKDSRLKLMDEVLSGMKVLKLCAWETAFGDKVMAIRQTELGHLQKYASLAAIGSFSWSLATFLVMLSTFSAYVLSGHQLQADKAFVALSLFNILYFPINLLPQIISYIVTATVSIRRVGKFLRLEEMDADAVSHLPLGNIIIKMDKATLTWGISNTENPTLSAVSLSVHEGALVAVVGQVGAGKSSLLTAMLGEMDKLRGSVNVKGSVAYVAQQAWIQNATLRDNILFGKPLDQQRYDQVLETCALLPDLAILPGGDQTEIGEKGINLSGGQKQRVSLARAVYQDADIYLLDDPLSAVDAHVGKHIFDKVIADTGLLQHKTRVLVTHGLHWLSRVHRVVVLVAGRVTEEGTYEELLTHNGPFAQFLRTYLLSEGEEEEETADLSDVTARRRLVERLDSIGSGSGTEAGQDAGTRPIGSTLQRRHTKATQSKSEADTTHQPEKQQVEKKTGSSLVEEERTAVGSVPLAVVVAYARALGAANTTILIGSFFLYKASSVAANLWLTVWTSDTTPINSTNYTATRDYYLGVYGGMGILQAVFILLYALKLAFSMVKASRLLHYNMLYRVLHSTMAFFDTTPSGRILNRFSRDIETVDNILPEIIRNWMFALFTVVSSLVVIAYSAPAFIAVLLPLCIVFYLIQRFYVRTSRQLKRLEATTRSPVYSNFSETLTGATTIRAYRAQEAFLHKSNRLVDHNLVFYFATVSSNRWLGFRLSFVSACVVLATAAFAVAGRDTLSAGIVGLAMSYALQATSELNWMVRCTSDLENNFVSVERIQEYTNTPSEAEVEIEATKPDPSWPMGGALTFQNYSTRYRDDLDLVLNDISFTIKNGERVGIVGRTGAGKSSLTLALFRIVEPASGTILLDGVDITTLGLHQLRTKITILPQDPVLFSGTLRFNADPLGAHSDLAIWEAIRRANLVNFVESLTSGLDYQCGEGGSNLSVGQRQLVCLARALLHKTRLLVLDEATAAVDLETDELIQATIQREFSDCTVLSIAHRVNTIMDYDRILVLDRGRVAEYDTPQTLLSDTDTLFYKMAKEAGLV